MSKRALFLAPLLLCSALFVYGQSAKESILDALTSYQTKLAEVKLSISNYEHEILNLQSQTETLEKQLIDSQADLQTVSKELERSRALLEASRLALENQETIYRELSTDLEALKRSFNRSRRLTKVLGLTSLAGACYIAGDIVGFW